MGLLSDFLHTELREQRFIGIAQKVEDTFGPNPCDHLRMVNEETSERITHLCDAKRCIHCGPRKAMTIQLQMEALGTYVWVARIENVIELDRNLARVKKQYQREGVDYQYQIVGDDSLGYIVVSNVEIAPEQRLMKLQDWTQRILDLYRMAGKRIRRSYSLGRVSLVPHRSRRGTRDKPSVWQVMTRRWALVRAVEDDTWDDMRDEIDYRNGNVFDEPPADWVSPA